MSRGEGEGGVGPADLCRDRYLSAADTVRLLQVASSVVTHEWRSVNAARDEE